MERDPADRRICRCRHNDDPVAMMPRMAWATAIMAVALLLWVPPLAAQTAEEWFDRGVAAVRAGNHERAIEHFEAARAAGLDTGALHFNLGVAYYRAGRIEAAETSFRRAVNSGTMVAPALYQLGRIAREQGDVAGARDHFRRAANAARTEALRSRARNALAALGTVRPPDFVYLSFGGGHDTNIALTPAEASGVSEESDQFLEFVLVGREPIDDRAYLRGSVYLQEFLDRDDFSLLSLRGGIGRVGLVGGNWRSDLWVDGRHREFGGKAFDNSLVGGAELRRPLGANWLLELGYRFEGVDGASRFGFLDGVDNRLAATLEQRGRDGTRLTTWLESSDRDDRETADDFFSFSWTGFGIDAGHGLRLNARDRLDFRIEWSRRDYDGTERRDGTALGGREDDLYGIAVGLDRHLDRDWTGRLSLRLEERDSNLSEFDYNREVLRLAVERVF